MKAIYFLFILMSLQVQADYEVKARNLSDKTGILIANGQVYMIQPGQQNEFYLPAPAGGEAIGRVETNGSWTFHSPPSFQDDKMYEIVWNWTSYDKTEKTSFLRMYTIGFSMMFGWIAFGWMVRAIKGAFQPVLIGGTD